LVGAKPGVKLETKKKRYSRNMPFVPKNATVRSCDLFGPWKVSSPFTVAHQLSPLGCLVEIVHVVRVVGSISSTQIVFVEIITVVVSTKVIIAKIVGVIVEIICIIGTIVCRGIIPIVIAGIIVVRIVGRIAI
jgi:hypothetical protein